MHSSWQTPLLQTSGSAHSELYEHGVADEASARAFSMPSGSSSATSAQEDVTHTCRVTQSPFVVQRSWHCPSIAHCSAPGQSLVRVQPCSSGSWQTRNGRSLDTQRRPGAQSRLSVQAL
jgi:hypothetical protein